MYPPRMFLAASLALLAAGCVATDIAATSLSEPLNPETSGKTLVLQSSVSVDLPHGYSADDLIPNTRWRQVGHLPQGDVLQPIARTYVVKAGPPVYDADLVVHQDGLVGVYIPSRSAFVNTTPTVYISFAEINP